MKATTITITTMGMITLTVIIIMTTDAASLMRLMSWLSPAFPIGAYSYSHGLERAVESGAICDRATLVDWLDADLRFGAGRSDGIFFAESWRAVDRSPTSPGRLTASTLSREGRGHTEPEEISCLSSAGSSPLPSRERAAAQPPGEGSDLSIVEAAESQESAPPPDILAVAELAAAMRATSELALESSQQGVAFLTAVRKAWPHPLLDQLAANLKRAGIAPMLPVAAGVACAVHGIALDMALPLYLHAGVANLINAAVRLVPLGQSDGQMALAALEGAVAATAAEALHAGLSGIGSAAFMIDIASMQHETQYTRLFRS